MYFFPSMLEMGLLENQEFPSEIYRLVAQEIAIQNSEVKDRDTLIDIVQSVLSVPGDRILSVTPEELENEFNCPRVW